MKQVRTEKPAVYNSKSTNINPIDINEEAILEQAREIIKKRVTRLTTAFSDPTSVVDYLSIVCSEYESEVFGLLLLDNQYRLIKDEILFKGTVDSCGVYPREILKTILLHNAVAVILYHNHPSGETEPSDADINITKIIKESVEYINARVLDHIIVGGTNYHSLAVSGQL